MAVNLESIKVALRETLEGLEVAGYSVEMDVSGSELEMRVNAGEGVCEDCLVPKPLFLQMVKDELAEGGFAFSTVNVSYPKDSGRQ